MAGPAFDEVHHVLPKAVGARESRARAYCSAARGMTTTPRVVTTACGSDAPHFLTYLTEHELALVLYFTAASPEGVSGPNDVICAPPKRKMRADVNMRADVGPYQGRCRFDPRFRMTAEELDAEEAKLAGLDPGRCRRELRIVYDDELPAVLHDRDRPPADADLRRMWRTAHGYDTPDKEDAHWRRSPRFQRLRAALAHVPHPLTRRRDDAVIGEIEPLEEAPEHMRVADLRAALTARGLETTGRKPALAARLRKDTENADYLERIRDEFALEPHMTAEIARAKHMTQKELANAIEQRFKREAMRTWWFQQRRDEQERRRDQED